MRHGGAWLEAIRPGVAWSGALVGALVISSCGGQTVITPETPTPEPTPFPEVDPHGEPPDWSTCFGGFQGRYYNLEATHPDVEPEDPELPEGTEPEDLDWWSDRYKAFERYDASLDFGIDWWPVDGGLAGDPAYFAVRWTAWIRATRDTTVTLSLGSSDDAWVLINGQVVASLPGIHPFEPQTLEIPLEARQYPLDVYFAHRAMPESAFRLRITGSDLFLCYPEY